MLSPSIMFIVGRENWFVEPTMSIVKRVDWFLDLTMSVFICRNLFRVIKMDIVAYPNWLLE